MTDSSKRRRTESYAQCRLVIPDCGMIDSSLAGLSRVAILRGDAPVSIGRDRSYDARIRLKKDLMASKSHASIYFDAEEATWNICDLGSTHGTTLVHKEDGTGCRLSPAKTASRPKRLLHLDRIQIGSTAIIVHIHNLPCQECCLLSNESNLLSLSCPPGDAAPPVKKRKKTKSTRPSVALPQPTAPLEVEREKTNYLDRAKLRRNYYGSSAPPSAPPSTSATRKSEKTDRPVQHTEVIDSGMHAKSLSYITPRAGLGSEKLVDEQERARVSELDWRARGKEMARERFRGLD